MLSSYFLELRTGTDYTVNDYDAARARLDASHKCASLSSLAVGYSSSADGHERVAGRLATAGRSARSARCTCVMS